MLPGEVVTRNTCLTTLAALLKRKNAAITSVPHYRDDTQ
jgi:hypothetical protein